MDQLLIITNLIIFYRHCLMKRSGVEGMRVEGSGRGGDGIDVWWVVVVERVDGREGSECLIQ